MSNGEKITHVGLILTTGEPASERVPITLPVCDVELPATKTGTVGLAYFTSADAEYPVEVDWTFLDNWSNAVMETDTVDVHIKPRAAHR